MADGTQGRGDHLEAGDFSAWVAGMEGVIRGEHGAVVPCGGCTACCSSSQFVAIAPDETDTLSHIPAELLFPAPRSPRGHVVLGYDERGRCPMLAGDGCSIYEHRPRACRAYDCRVLPAAGLEVTDGSQAGIARQARRWRFSFPTEADGTEHEAVRASAAFLARHPDLLPDPALAAHQAQLAVLAIQVHGAFLRRDQESGATKVVDPGPDAVRVEVRRGTARRPQEVTTP